jgi:hypothetical protein
MCANYRCVWFECNLTIAWNVAKNKFLIWSFTNYRTNRTNKNVQVSLSNIAVVSLSPLSLPRNLVRLTIIGGFDLCNFHAFLLMDFFLSLCSFAEISCVALHDTMTRSFPTRVYWTQWNSLCAQSMQWKKRFWYHQD